MYVVVKDGVIHNIINTLPKAFVFPDGASTGNFDMMDAEMQCKAGFFPLEEDAPRFDDRYQYLALSGYTVEAEKVIRHWHATDRDIAELKAEKIAAVNRIRKRKISDGFLFQGNKFDSGAASRQHITAMATAVALGMPFLEKFAWYTKDNKEMTFSEREARNFFIAAQNHIHRYHLIAWKHKATIAGLETAQSIADYDETAGW